MPYPATLGRFTTLSKSCGESHSLTKVLLRSVLIDVVCGCESANLRFQQLRVHQGEHWAKTRQQSILKTYAISFSYPTA